MNQSERILSMLQVNGNATNVQLNDICFRYVARIHELRKKGYLIRTVREKGSFYRFIYEGYESPKTSI